MDDARIEKVLAPVSPEEQAKREERVRERFWRKAKRVAARVPYMEDLAAAYYCAIDEATPSRVRGILLAALAYFILPTDIVPDFILAFGFTDDVAVATAAIAAVKPHIEARHYAAARKALAES